jgi:hypothetical protein
MTGLSGIERAELSVSDQSHAMALRKFLPLAVPDAKVSLGAGIPEAGELGALDVIEVLASSSGLIAACRMLPEFLRSRRTTLSITATVRGEPLTFTATNLDEVLPVLEKLLDG